MKSFKEFLEESVDHNEVAKKRFDKLMAGTKTIGSHKGKVRVYYNHTGGTIKRTLVGDHNHASYSKPSKTSGSGHFFASHYSAKPGHDVYVHVKLKKGTDLSDKEALSREIESQNPHTKGTGHATNLAYDIVQHHGKE